jgi:hypothetical protein
MSDEEGVTPFEAVHDTVPVEVTLLPGKGALGTWRSIGQKVASHCARECRCSFKGRVRW